MSDRSPHLDMPFLQPAQAQKHVTHNEALHRLDMVVQLSVLAFEALTPPGAPQDGDRYALGSGASGAWAGQDGRIAQWSPPAWQFVTPQEGWRAWDTDAGTLRIFMDGTWQVPPAAMLGINTSADAVNRLAVAAPATLLSHEGGDHQLKINKAGATDTATLLFQSNWTGHAEMGLAGDTLWRLKVSADGSSWTDALVIDSGTGLLSGAAVQQTPQDTAPGKVMRADFGYCPGNLLGTVSQTGGVPDGAVIERGGTADGDYVRYADGTQICWATRSFDNVDITTPSGGAYRSELFAVAFPTPFAAPPAVTVTGSRQDGTWDVWAVTSAVTETQFNGLHMKLTSDVSQSRTLNYVAFGRWF